MIILQSICNSVPTRRFIRVACISAALVAPPAGCAPVYGFGFEEVTGPRDHPLIVTLTDEMLQKSPKWSLQAPNPPLSARKAIRLATELQNKLVADTNVYEWKFLASKLCRDSDPELDRWYWRVEFEAKVRPGLPRDDDPQELVVIVLMDATVVQPVPEQSSVRSSGDAKQNNN